MKHKKLVITLSAVLSVTVLLAIFITIWFWGDEYKDFDDFRKEIQIEGLADGACPQGITNVKAEIKDGTQTKYALQNFFFISAYFKNKPSRIYVTGEKDGFIGYVTMKNTDGSDYTGHCGGIASNGAFLWISSDDTVFVAKTASSSGYKSIAEEIIKKAADDSGEKSVAFSYSFAANCNASFLYYYDADDGATSSPSSSDKLYLGEFYRKGNYETAKKHRLTTPGGDYNTAFAYEYSINTSSSSSNNTGLSCISSSYLSEDSGDVPKIQKIISITAEVQGFARTSDGKLVLSQSYGLKNSTLSVYDWSKIDTGTYTTSICKTYFELNDEYFEYSGVKTASGAPATTNNTDKAILRVYFADSQTHIKDYSIPCMSEGICVSNDRVYVLFESGAKKYRTFVRQILENVYSFIPNKNN